MKTPNKTEMIVGFSLIVVCMVILSMFGLTMERCGYYTIGISVGVIFSMFGLSAHKSMKNTLMIMGKEQRLKNLFKLIYKVLTIIK